MTTTCLRSFKLQLHPSFLLKRIGSSSQICLPRTHACYQYQNIDSRRQQCQAEQANYSESRLTVRTKTSLIPSLDRLAPLDLACYEPFKIDTAQMLRLTDTCDTPYPIDGGAGTEISRHLYEEDLERNMMRGGDLPMAVLMDSLPVALSAQIADARQQCAPLTDYERSMILSSNVKQPPTAAPPGDPTAKPSDEQLEIILLKLSAMVPYFFTKPQDYTIYHNNLVFQNNIRGATTHGLPAYIQQMVLLRLLGHLKFAFVKMEVLKVTKHSEDGTVRIRWRIQGISGLRVLLLFWKYKLWNFREIMQKKTDWYDGFSTFYVGGDGLVHKHVCDKMMPDDHKEKSPASTNLAAKLALMLGAIPQPSIEDLNAICMALEHTPK